MDQSKIGNFISMVRKEKGYTQKQLADIMGISEKTVSKWECGNGLPEVSLMLPLCDVLSVSVNELLMGERLQFMNFFTALGNTMEELLKQVEYAQLKYRIFKMYGFDIHSISESSFGAGSITYFVDTNDGKYVVKYFTENSMNHPENEALLCEFLLDKGIQVCAIIKNCMGQYISEDENGRRYHVQKYIEGETKDYFEAPDWFLPESAKLLGEIHTALNKYPELPIGIGKGFFKYCTIENALRGYEETLKYSIEIGDAENALRIQKNMEILKRMPVFTVEMDMLTYVNTHGDYMITQMILGEKKINACIDWTTACKHPAIWEIIRSYVCIA